MGSQYYSKQQIKLRCGSVVFIHILCALSVRTIWSGNLSEMYLVAITTMGIVIAGALYLIDVKTRTSLMLIESGTQGERKRIKIHFMHNGSLTVITCLDFYLFCRISFGYEIVSNPVRYSIISFGLLIVVELITYGKLKLAKMRVFKNTFLLIALVVLLIVIVACSVLHSLNSYTGVMKKNWDLDIASSCKTEYKKETETSIFGDGYRYHVLICKRDNIDSDISFRSYDDISGQTEKEIKEIMDTLNIPVENRPSGANLSYYVKGENDEAADKLYLLLDEARGKLYIIESLY